MFTFASDGKVYWPVTLRTRTDEGVVDAKAVFGFVIFNRDELRERDKQAMQARIERQEARETDGEDITAAELRKMVQDVDGVDADKRAQLRMRIFDWRQISDAEGKPLAFDPATLDAMLNDPLIFEDLWIGLQQASLGAVRKN